jgi:hypothetical protein
MGLEREGAGKIESRSWNKARVRDTLASPTAHKSMRHRRKHGSERRGCGERPERFIAHEASDGAEVFANAARNDVSVDGLLVRELQVVPRSVMTGKEKTREPHAGTAYGEATGQTWS